MNNIILEKTKCFFIHPTIKRLFEGLIIDFDDTGLKVRFTDIDFYTKEIKEYEVTLMYGEVFEFPEHAIQNYIAQLESAFWMEYKDRTNKIQELKNKTNG